MDDFFFALKIEYDKQTQNSADSNLQVIELRWTEIAAMLGNVQFGIFSFYSKVAQGDLFREVVANEAGEGRRE